MDDVDDWTLINAGIGDDICESKRITTYGLFECTTFSAVYSSAIDVGGRFKGNDQPCESLNGLSCTYATFGASD